MRMPTTDQLKRRFLVSVLSDTLRKVSSKRHEFLLTMVCDLGFLASLVLLNSMMTRLLPNPASMIVGPWTKFFIALCAAIVYLTSGLLSYSFFKLVILNLIRKIFGAKLSDLSPFLGLLLLNSKIFLVYSALFLLFSAMFVFAVRVELLVSVRTFFIVLTAILLYLSINIGHSLFMQNRTKKIISTTFEISFRQTRRYLGLIAFTIITFFVLAAAYYVFDWTLLHILGRSISVPWVNTAYSFLNTVIIASAAIGLVAFNRVYFYNIILRMHGTKYD